MSFSRRLAIAIVAALVALALPAASCFADELVKTDGTKLSGRVVAEDDAVITFEIQSGGMTMRQKVARAKVRSITRDVREGPGYCAIPLFGAIGEDVTAEAFEAALNSIGPSKPRYVVLVIDSPGGAISDMARIVQLIDARRDVEFIAYVKGKALSAAAIIALACPRIYLSPEATVGAAVPLKYGPDGTPVAIEAKFQSMILAQMRASALVGGHDELWARAMSDIDVGVCVTEDLGGRPVLVESEDEPGARVIKRKGNILSMTAVEAVRYGFAAGTAGDAKSLHASLGHAAWHVADERPWHVMAARAQAVKAEHQRDAERLDRLAAYSAYMQRILPELQDIDRKLAPLLAAGEGAIRKMDELKASYEAEDAALKAEYEAAVKRLKGVPNAAYHVNQTKDTFRARAKAMSDRYQAEIRNYRAVSTRMAPQIQKLAARRTELTGAAPAID